MTLSRFALTCTTLTLGFALACNGKSPSSPSPSDPGSTAANPDGSTLKIGAPPLQSPANGTQLQGNPVLVFGNVVGRFATFPVAYDLEVRNAQNAVVLSPKVAPAAGATTSFTITQQLDFDAVFSWRVRAAYNSAVGPWSETRTFRTLPAGYIRGTEVFDPLSNGRTVGRIVGPTQFVPGMGLELLTQDSYVEYRLESTLESGEMSLMLTGIDEGSPGDKSKVMSMREDNDGFITDNDYRATIEKRGRSYPNPGAVTFRIIDGDADDDDRIHDGARIVLELNDESWYFWKFSWNTGSARLTVRRDSETGPVIYDEGVGLEHAYRPNPHYVFIGSPPLRNGSLDQSIPGMIVKDFWVSGNPRPRFPIFSSPSGR